MVAQIPILTKYINIYIYIYILEFQPMATAPDDTLYHQTKIPIGFWYRRGLNPKSLIQPSETLPVKLTGTHQSLQYNC